MRGRYEAKDHNLGNRANPMAGSHLIGYVADKTDAVGRTVYDVLSEWTSVKDFGAVGDGVADDTAAIQSAVDSIEESGLRGILYIPAGKYKITRALTLDISYVSVYSFGATLDCTSITSGNALEISGTQLYSKDPGVWYQSCCFIQGLAMKGDSETGSATGIYVNTANSAMAKGSAHFIFRNCAIHTFGTGIKMHNGTYCVTLDNCGIINCNTGLYVASGTDCGERIVCKATTIGNCNDKGIWIDNVSADLHLIGCSFDYNGTVIDADGGRSTFTDCHIEGSGDTDYWFDIAGSSTLVRLLACDIVVTANKSTYHMFNAATPTTVCSLELDGVYITAGTNYDLQTLVTGPGRVVARNIVCPTGDQKMAIAIANNLINNYTFVPATGLGEWTLGGDANPAIDATTSYTADGSGSVKFDVAADNNDSWMYADYVCQPGQRPIVSFYYKSANLAGHGNLYIGIQYLDSGDNLIGSELTDIVNANTAPNWGIKRCFATGVSNFLAPHGAAKCRLKLRAEDIDASTEIWVDELFFHLV